MGTTKQLPRGVTIRTNRVGQTLYISFMYRGIRCREPLSGLPVTTGNINYASRLLGEIHNKIERGTFDYAEQFPNSSTLKKLGYGTKLKTVLEYINEYIELCKERGAELSTIKGYKGYVSTLSPLHALTAKELTPGRIKEWIIGRNVKIKTLRNQMSLLSASIEEAITEGIISINPCSQITVARYKDITPDDEDYVDPFTPDEIKYLTDTIKHEEYKNQVIVSFNTGMRPSELIALDWENVDFAKKIIRVECAVVYGQKKAPKTTSGIREIELNDAAINALLSQKKYTYLRHSRKVFINPRTRKDWENASQTRLYWMRAIEKAGIRYRNQYQTRHTFATMNISKGVNLFWLTQQMGHTSPEMIFKHYGRYLKEYDGNISIQNDTHLSRAANQ